MKTIELLTRRSEAHRLPGPVVCCQWPGWGLGLGWAGVSAGSGFSPHQQVAEVNPTRLRPQQARPPPGPCPAPTHFGLILRMACPGSESQPGTAKPAVQVGSQATGGGPGVGSHSVRPDVQRALGKTRTAFKATPRLLDPRTFVLWKTAENLAKGHLSSVCRPQHKCLPSTREPVVEGAGRPVRLLLLSEKREQPTCTDCQKTAPR